MGPNLGALLEYPAHSAAPANQRKLGSARYQPPEANQTARPGCALDPAGNRANGGASSGRPHRDEVV